MMAQDNNLAELKAKAAGDTDEQYNLAWAYFNGIGVAQDDAEAVGCYNKAAE